VLVKNGEEKIDPKEVCGLPLGLTPESGVPIEVRIGRFGPFISNGTDRASVPDGIAPDELSLDKALGILAEAAKGPQALGADPSSGLPVFIKKGRFGPYVQLGEQVEGGDKPKMASLLPGMVPDSVTLEQAAALLTFPKVLGKHPESNEEIIASNGRYGPYIKAGTDTRSIPTDEVSLLDITLEKAIEILARPKTRGRQNATPKALKEVGKHPVSELVITLRSGRYGPYVSDGKVNASLPRGANPDTLTIAEAVQLIDARAATVGDAPPKQKRKSSGTRSRKKSADA
jgi:DNA topoisomerase-1